MQSAVIIAAIALAVFLGYKTKINTGFFCIVFAYFIGCFWLDLKPKALIAFWPTNTMFVIISVSLFYNVAAANGTLEKISRSLLYACCKFPGMLPYALFAVAVILSVMGAAYFTVLAFLAPITLLICEESKMDKLTGAVAINCGALAGGDFPTAALGVIFRGLMDSSYEAAPELEAIDSFVTCLKMFGLAVLFSLILVTIFRFALPANRNIGKDIKFEKPEAYTTAQKQTLYLMVAMMAVVLVFPLLKLLIPGLSATTGLGAANLFTCTVLGAQSSAISPFSSGGSLILGSCGNEEERSSLFNRLLFVATPISIGVAAIFNLIVSMVL